MKIKHIIHPRCYSKIIGHILKNKEKKMDMKIKPRSRHGHKYNINKKCLSKMMLIFIKQHLSNIWSSIHEKVKQHWGWV